MSILIATIILTSFLLVIFLRQKWIQRLAFQSAVKQYGCREPRRYPHRLPFGIDLQRARIRSRDQGGYNSLYQEQFQKFGRTWTENLGVTTIVNTIEPENLRQVATTSFQDYGKAPMRSKSLSPLLGNGIFAQDGHSWKHSRNLITPLFVRAEISDIDSFRLHVDRFFTQVPADGTTVDLQPLLSRLFFDASTAFLFGEIASSSQEFPLDTQQFIDAFSQALHGAGRRAQVGPLRFVYFWGDKNWRCACKKVHDFIDKCVALALAQTRSGQQETHDPKASRRYVLLHEMAKVIRDPIELRFQILGVFLPARETTGVAVSNILFNLARNPSVWTDLRLQALALGDQPLTFELLNSLSFFKHVIFESLRLQGPSGRIARTAIRDTILPRGGGSDGTSPVFVPKGTIVALHTYAQNHSREVWGDDAEEFNPSRWSGGKNTWEWTPFWGGPRICPARQQVLTQSIYLLVRLVTAFERIENRDPILEYVESTKMLTESRNGVKVALYMS